MKKGTCKFRFMDDGPYIELPNGDLYLLGGVQKMEIQRQVGQLSRMQLELIDIDPAAMMVKSSASSAPRDKPDGVSWDDFIKESSDGAT